MKWSRMAAEQGNAKAEFLIGKMIRERKGTTEDMEQAVYWLRESANQGFVEAEKLLGMILCLGKEVKRETDEGVMWIQRRRENSSNRLWPAAVLWRRKNCRRVDLRYPTAQYTSVVLLACRNMLPLSKHSQVFAFSPFLGPCFRSAMRIGLWLTSTSARFSFAVRST